MILPTFSRAVAITAAKQLATVDYTVANRVTEDVAHLVEWSYTHDQAWVAPLAIDLLYLFDDVGSRLILLVAWIVHHTA